MSVNVNGSVIPLGPLVNIDVYAGARMVFFDDHGTTFFHDYRGCRARAPMCQERRPLAPAPAYMR